MPCCVALCLLQLEAEYLAAAKRGNVKRPIAFADLPEAAPATTNTLLDFKNSKKNKKRWVGAGWGVCTAGSARQAQRAWHGAAAGVPAAAALRSRMAASTHPRTR